MKEFFQEKVWFTKSLALFVIVLSIFFVIKSVNEIKQGQLIGENIPATNMIIVEGDSEILAVPDIATFSFSVNEEAKIVADAQKKATEKINKTINFLKNNGIDEKDIKTVDYNISPKYEYQEYKQKKDFCEYQGCPFGRSVLVGYVVSQTTEVKVRKIEKAGDVLSGIGSFEVQNVSGLSFKVNNREELKKQARDEAIEKAIKDAKNLAKALNVKLVRVVNFNEANFWAPELRLSVASGEYGMEKEKESPEINPGENKITAKITITYEIR